MKLITLLPILFLAISINAQNKLPLEDYPVPTSSSDYFVLFLSGDGGWHKGDHSFAAYYQEKGIPVVGLNARSYFNKEKSKTRVIADLKEIIDNYSQKWKKKKVLLVGYSFSADVLPHAVNHIDIEYQQKIKGLVLLMPSKYATYEVTFASMLNMIYSGDLVLPEIKAINKELSLFLVCNEEDETICGALPTATYPRMVIEGGHSLKEKLVDVAKETFKHFDVE